MSSTHPLAAIQTHAVSGVQAVQPEPLAHRSANVFAIGSLRREWIDRRKGGMTFRKEWYDSEKKNKLIFFTNVGG